jgi:hypothetical protein
MSKYDTLIPGGGFARGRGRIQRQIRTAFSMIGKSMLSTSELLGWTHSRLHLLRAPVLRHHRRRLRSAADQLAERVGRSSRGKGRPIIWRLKDGAEHG